MRIKKGKIIKASLLTFLLVATFIIPTTADDPFDPADTPVFSNESPTNESVNVSQSPTLSVQVNDPEGDTMDITWWTNSTPPPETIGCSLEVDSYDDIKN